MQGLVSRCIRTAALVSAAVLALGVTSAQAFPFGGPSHSLFVQTDNPNGNRIVVYDRADDGSLTQAGSYATGGLGGVLTGSAVDHLASQGSLAYDRRHAVLYAVNAGSSSVSVFAVRGDRLVPLERLPAGGPFPVSVAVHDGLVYVLDAEGGGFVQGYRSIFGFLLPIPGSQRALGLDPAATPQFTHTPGQVAFTPDGSRLVVTTKANGSAIDVFGVGPDGRLSSAPTVNAEPGAVPFAVSFDVAGHLVVAEAGTNALATFGFAGGGTLTPLAQLGTGQAATCWVEPANGFFYASNAGSGTLSGFSVGPGGQLTLVGATPTDAGTVDAAAAPDGRFLYVQTGAQGIVDAFRTNAGGSLTPVGSVTVPGAVGGEGIVAS